MFDPNQPKVTVNFLNELRAVLCKTRGREANQARKLAQKDGQSSWHKFIVIPISALIEIVSKLIWKVMFEDFCKFKFPQENQYNP